MTMKEADVKTLHVDFWDGSPAEVTAFLRGRGFNVTSVETEGLSEQDNVRFGPNGFVVTVDGTTVRELRAALDESKFADAWTEMH